MGKFQLRTARAEDALGILALIDASVRGLQARDYTPAQIDGALATVFTVDSQLIADGTYFVAFDESGELAGCGGWSFRKTLYGGDHQVETIESEMLDPEVDAAKIRAIFVHPKFARRGLGSLILDASERAAIAMGFRRFEMESCMVQLHIRADQICHCFRQARIHHGAAPGFGVDMKVVKVGKL